MKLFVKTVLTECGWIRFFIFRTRDVNLPTAAGRVGGIEAPFGPKQINKRGKRRVNCIIIIYYFYGGIACPPKRNRMKRGAWKKKKKETQNSNGVTGENVSHAFTQRRRRGGASRTCHICSRNGGGGTNASFISLAPLSRETRVLIIIRISSSAAARRYPRQDYFLEICPAHHLYVSPLSPVNGEYRRAVHYYYLT